VLTGAAATIGFAVLTRLPAGGYSPVLFVVTLIGFGTAGTAGPHPFIWAERSLLPAPVICPRFRPQAAREPC
jgi:hypothetical protein